MNKQEIEIENENLNQSKLWIRNYSLSIVLHLVIIIVLFYLLSLQSDPSRINSSFFTIDTKEYVEQKSESIRSEVEKDETKKPILSEDQKQAKAEALKALSFSDIVADTTNLDQVYSESTLNVSIKYPKGWTFIDQNKKKKLDGVTFWANDGQYNPPPYIHLEVVDKDMFIDKRYAFKIDLEKSQAYYNDPEEMQGYITQIFYIRTEEEEDFRLKLMMRGELEFKAFQPRFLAILKSFNFGDSLF
ncbi:MAG: hypothetical protein IPJ23_09380 [Ignavibacteriales bacterium]|nr:hypothetical protein [Ignavibacteriales bacterium]